MNNNGIDILGISGMRWSNSGAFKSDTSIICSIGNNFLSYINEVGIIVSVMVEKKPVRAMLIKILGHPVNINVIQCHARTTGKHETELNAFYIDINSYLAPNKLNLIIADFDAKVRVGQIDGVVGEYGQSECKFKRRHCSSMFPKRKHVHYKYTV